MRFTIVYVWLNIYLNKVYIIIIIIILYSCGKIELFRSLRAQVSREIKKAKSTFYDKKVAKTKTNCLFEIVVETN